jgi:hypothetical protein
LKPLSVLHPTNVCSVLFWDGNPEAVMLSVVDNTNFERSPSAEILIEDKEVLIAY